MKVNEIGERFQKMRDKQPYMTGKPEQRSARMYNVCITFVAAQGTYHRIVYNYLSP